MLTQRKRIKAALGIIPLTLLVGAGNVWGSDPASAETVDPLVPDVLLELQQLAQEQHAAQQVASAELSLEAAVGRVQAYYESVTDFVANFEQEYESAALGETRTSTGRVYFKKPGMMRWDYAAPTERYFISDGSDLWVYEPEYGQYFSESLGDSQLPSALRFMMGEGQLDEEFEVSLVSQNATRITLSLVPKTASAQYTRLQFTANAETGQVLSTTIFDAIGNSNTLSFTDIVTNQGLPTSPFSFTPPEGATRVTAPSE